MNAPTTIHVDGTARGAWEVVLPARGERVLCRTLDDAVRVGYRFAADGEGCELVVRDAYHRLLRCERVPASSARN
jgi:hypothetical protein